MGPFHKKLALIHTIGGTKIKNIDISHTTQVERSNSPQKWRKMSLRGPEYVPKYLQARSKSQPIYQSRDRKNSEKHETEW